MIHKLPPQEDCASIVHFELLLKKRKVDELDLHHSKHFLLHLRDLSEDEVFVCLLSSADVVKYFFHEYIRDKIV